ncbi:hypothetical protein PYCC9005_001567 [Savitreella phatthalungensis]
MGVDILISGCSIAGPVLAYWLLRGDPTHRITIIERDTELRLTGQSVDIRDGAVDVMRAMGVEDEVRKHITPETGLSFVDEDDKVLLQTMATGDTSNQSFTSEFEVLRGELSNVFVSLVRDKVKIVLGETVREISEEGEGVDVTFASGKKATYGLVVACDGIGSRIRNITLGTLQDRRRHFYPLHLYCAYATVDKNLLGGQYLAKWATLTEGRVALIRPDTQPGRSRVAILKSFSNEKAEIAFRNRLTGSSEAQRQAFKEVFAGSGPLVEEAVALAAENEEFYSTELAQVRVQTLSKGRVAWIGDAGHCGTPLTGMGTSMAIIAAYVTAGEVTKALEEGRDVGSGLKRMSDIILPFTRDIQSSSPTQAKLMFPQTKYGLLTLRLLVRLAAFLQLPKIAEWLGSFSYFQSKIWRPQQYVWREISRSEK